MILRWSVSSRSDRAECERSDRSIVQVELGSAVNRSAWRDCCGVIVVDDEGAFSREQLQFDRTVV